MVGPGGGGGECVCVHHDVHHPALCLEVFAVQLYHLHDVHHHVHVVVDHHHTSSNGIAA